MTTRVLLRGGCVLTLGARTQNLGQGDVLIEGDRIAEVGPGLRARDAEVVDAADTIVMPGFVDTHRHTWTSLFRNLGDPSDGDASASLERLRSHHGPQEVYAGTLIGLLGAVEAGITTVVDWADFAFTPETADAALRAHADAGIRSVFVVVPGETATRELVARLADAAGPSTTIALGFGFGEPGRAADAWTLARELGVGVFVHAGPERSGGPVGTALDRSTLGDHVTLVHQTRLDEADLAAVVAAGAHLSLAPSSEMAGAYGSPRIQELIDRGVRPGLGIDHEGMAPGDMFAQMRQAISLQHATVFERKLAGKAGLPRLMSTRDVIRFATSEGARVAGLGSVTGSIEPGRQGDVVVLRTDRPNVWPINDPIGAVVWGMDTSNIERVYVGGRLLMRDGELTTDVANARSLAGEARERVIRAAGVAAGAPAGSSR